MSLPLKTTVARKLFDSLEDISLRAGNHLSKCSTRRRRNDTPDNEGGEKNEKGFSLRLGNDWNLTRYIPRYFPVTPMVAARCEIVGGVPTTLWVKGPIDTRWPLKSKGMAKEGRGVSVHV